MRKILHLSEQHEELFVDATDLFLRNFPNSNTVQDMYLNPRRFIENVIAVVKGEKVVGALKRGYNPERDAISVDFLAVDEKYRKSGIGRMLLSELEEFARKRQNKRVCLLPRVKPEVINFYSKLGYSFVPDHSQCWMEKEL